MKHSSIAIVIIFWLANLTYTYSRHQISKQNGRQRGKINSDLAESKFDKFGYRRLRRNDEKENLYGWSNSREHVEKQWVNPHQIIEDRSGGTPHKNKQGRLQEFSYENNLGGLQEVPREINGGRSRGFLQESNQGNFQGFSHLTRLDKFPHESNKGRLKRILHESNGGRPQENTYNITEGRLAVDKDRERAVRFPCPLPEDIAPCVCTINDEAAQLNLNCSEVESREHLADIFKQDIPVKTFHLFELSYNKNIYVLGDVFNGASFEVVRMVDDANLAGIGEYALTDSAGYLMEIHVERSNLHAKTFPFPSLVLYPKLEALKLKYNLNLTFIPLLHSDSLAEVDFFGSQIADLQPGTFDHLPNLKSLDLSYNDLVRLGSDTLMINDLLEGVYLDTVNLDTIEPGAFVLAEDVGTTNRSLELYLSHNQLTRLQPNTVPFSDRPTRLFLNSNNLYDIQQGAFVLPPTTVEFKLVLNVAYNNLTNLAEEAFGEIFPHITTFYGQGNPLVCGCEMAWLVTNESYMAVVDEGTACADGTSLVDLDPDSYANFCLRK